MPQPRIYGGNTTFERRRRRGGRIANWNFSLCSRSQFARDDDDRKREAEQTQGAMSQRAQQSANGRVGYTEGGITRAIFLKILKFKKFCCNIVSKMANP